MALLAGLGLVTASAALQEHPQAPHRHAEGKQLINAVAQTPESIKAGGGVYAKPAPTATDRMASATAGSPRRWPPTAAVRRT